MQLPHFCFRARSNPLHFDSPVAYETKGMACNPCRRPRANRWFQRFQNLANEDELHWPTDLELFERNLLSMSQRNVSRSSVRANFEMVCSWNLWFIDAAVQKVSCNKQNKYKQLIKIWFSHVCQHISDFTSVHSVFIHVFYQHFPSESSSCWDWLQPPNWGYATPLGDRWTDQMAMARAWRGHGMTWYHLKSLFILQSSILWQKDVADSRNILLFLSILHLFRTGVIASQSSDAEGLSCQPWAIWGRSWHLKHLDLKLSSGTPVEFSWFHTPSRCSCEAWLQPTGRASQHGHSPSAHRRRCESNRCRHTHTHTFVNITAKTLTSLECILTILSIQNRFISTSIYGLILLGGWLLPSALYIPTSTCLRYVPIHGWVSSTNGREGNVKRLHELLQELHCEPLEPVKRWQTKIDQVLLHPQNKETEQLNSIEMHWIAAFRNIGLNLNISQPSQAVRHQWRHEPRTWHQWRPGRPDVTGSPWKVPVANVKNLSAKSDKNGQTPVPQYTTIKNMIKNHIISESAWYSPETLNNDTVKLCFNIHRIHLAKSIINPLQVFPSVTHTSHFRNGLLWIVWYCS